MMNDILETLKMMISSFHADAKESAALMKAFSSNFMLTGIIDSNGCFRSKVFSSSYIQKKLKIEDLRMLVGI